MGMSIDKTIDFFNGLECHTPQAKDARDVVVDTMRKYQRIRQIYMTHHYTDEEVIEKIKEVIKLG